MKRKITNLNNHVGAQPAMKKTRLNNQGQPTNFGVPPNVKPTKIIKSNMPKQKMLKKTNVPTMKKTQGGWSAIDVLHPKK